MHLLQFDQTEVVGRFLKGIRLSSLVVGIVIAQKDVFLGLFLSVEDSKLVVLLLDKLLKAKIEDEHGSSILNTKTAQRTQIFACSDVVLD